MESVDGQPIQPGRWSLGARSSLLLCVLNVVGLPLLVFLNKLLPLGDSVVFAYLLFLPSLSSCIMLTERMKR